MQRWIIRLQAMLLLGALLCGIHGAQAEQTEEIIRIYSQHRYWVSRDDCTGVCHIPLKTTTKSNDMCTSGCMIWAFVHAIEWCRQARMGTSAATALVKDFIEADAAPWDVLFVIDEDYHSVVRAHGVAVEEAPPTTEKELIRFFRRNGAVVCNMGGHCAAAIGYTYHDYDWDGEEEMMIHMVDSALWSSAAKQRIYDYASFEWIPATKVCGGEFWLPQSTYEQLDRLALAPMQETADAP